MDEGYFRINAFWDEETEGWTATSPDALGFSVAAETYEELLDALRAGLPEAAAARGAPIEDFDRQVRIFAAGFPACGC